MFVLIDKALRKIKYMFFCVIFGNKTTVNEIFLLKEEKRLKRKYGKYISHLIEYYESKDEKYEQRIWFCWLQGIESAPELVKLCYKSVCKNLGREYKMCLVTYENLHEYIEIPDYIQCKLNNNSMCNAHFADYIRIELLYKFGGIWLDSTTFMGSNKIPFYFKQDFFVFKHINLDKSDENVVFSCNWLIVCNEYNMVVYLMHNLLNEFWKKETYPKNYFFFDIFMKIIFKQNMNLFKNIISVSPIDAHMFQFEYNNITSIDEINYYLGISPIQKLNYKNNDFDNSFCYRLMKGEI